MDKRLEIDTGSLAMPTNVWGGHKAIKIFNALDRLSRYYQPQIWFKATQTKAV